MTRQFGLRFKDEDKENFNLESKQDQVQLGLMSKDEDITYITSLYIFAFMRFAPRAILYFVYCQILY